MGARSASSEDYKDRKQLPDFRLFSNYSQYLLHDFFDRLVGRIDDHRVGRRIERRRGARRSSSSRAASAVPTSLTEAAPNEWAGSCGLDAELALLRRRVEIDLHVGVWRDHRADVSSFHHHSAAIANLPLTLDQDGAHSRQSGHGCDAPGRSRACGSPFVTSTPSAVTARSRNIDLRARSANRATASSSSSGDVSLRLPSANGAVSAPLSTWRKPSAVCNRCARRCLSGSGRSIDGDDWEFHCREGPEGRTGRKAWTCAFLSRLSCPSRLPAEIRSVTCAFMSSRRLLALVLAIGRSLGATFPRSALSERRRVRGSKPPRCRE